jgi:hypothetical protein
LHAVRRILATSFVTLLAVVGAAPAEASGASPLTIDPTGSTGVVPSGFVGLSLEYPAVTAYAGDDPHAVNPVLLQLIRNLSAGQAPELRIGGESSDWSWWPVPGMRRPPGIKYTLTRGWVAVARAVAQALSARMILGIDFEADSARLAGAEARALLAGIGGSRIEALELGNEPELYGSWSWYRTADGHLVNGRAADWNFDVFTPDFVRIGKALPSTPLAGPAVGGSLWMKGRLGELIAADSRLKVVTLHRYPLLLCFKLPSDPEYPTIHNLLAPTASANLAEGIAPYVSVAHARHLMVRIDEMNTISCGHVPGVSKSFAAALWALDALFEMASVGVDGVNIHTYPGATDELFTFTRARGRWQAVVEPEYFGLMMFAQAAPPGSRLLPIGGAAPHQLRTWATRAPDGRVRVVLINDGGGPRVLGVKLAGASAAASLLRLQAPGLSSARGITLGGHGFGSRTSTGVLAGGSRPQTVTPVGATYTVSVPGASAALLTIP